MNGIKAISFESRMASVMQAGLAKHGADVFVAPSMKEIPLDENGAAFVFAKQLLEEEIDVFIGMTGVGVRYLLKALEVRYSGEDICEALRKTKVVVRGPKPLSVFKELNIPVLASAEEPNTWHEVMKCFEGSESELLQGKRVAVQEYGATNEEFHRALKICGADVLSVPVYRWALPDDTKPLKEAVQRILNGKCDFIYITSAQQVRHIFQIVSEVFDPEAFVEACNKVVLCSVGPTATQALKEHGLEVDFEPSHPKMGQLIAESARQARELLERKRKK